VAAKQSIWNRIMRIGLLLIALGVAGCAATPERHWSKAGADESQVETDLEACRNYARSEVKVQSDIDQDIAASSTDPFGPAMSGGTDYSASATEQRYRKILDRCMADLGYGVAP
jgi:hypothetical protein